MTVGLRLFCFVLALILFGIAAVWSPPRGNLIAAGLFFATAAVAFG
jgi:hypothetical protein